MYRYQFIMGNGNNNKLLTALLNAMIVQDKIQKEYKCRELTT